jgi:antitoxin (DNA-binding transcriptional repressor) of toxin-antitoxin stability system
MVKARGVCVQPRDTRWGGPGLDLDTARRGTAVRLVSRGNPVFSISAIGRNERDGIAVRRRVQGEMPRILEGGKYIEGRREAAISIGREGTCERDMEDLTTG